MNTVLVVLAHSDRVEVQRLLRVLSDFPVVLHCDSKTPAAELRAMTADTGARIQLAPRRNTQPASWSLVSA